MPKQKPLLPPAKIYAKRRARLAQLMQVDGASVAIIPTTPEVHRSRDTHFPYRPDSYFDYLTGFQEPGSVLVLTSAGQSILFCREKDPEREIWDGERLGVEAAPAKLGIDQAYPLSALDEQLTQLLAHQQAVWWPFAFYPEFAARLEKILGVLRSRSRQGITAPAEQHDVCVALDEMRLIKDDSELNKMRKAASISAQAHLRAMRACATQSALREYHLEAELLYEFRKQGAQAPAYNAIVAAGANACVLHYQAGATLLEPGELCLIDAACEWEGYASDITRTFPVNGRYTPQQRTVYDVVQEAQQQAIEAIAPGLRFADLHQIALKVLCQGMLDLGLLQRSVHGSVDNVIESKAYQAFYMHGTSHWIGRDVHDCGDYNEPTEMPSFLKSNKKDKKPPSRLLQPGMVLTVEPGLYIRPSSKVKKSFWNIGIRIEDDVVVTSTGYEILSRGVPVDPDEIEAWMRNP